MNSPYRTHNNIRLTRALFYEVAGEDKSGVIYTLKDRDHIVDGNVLPSLYRLYMEMEDLTEYEFANKYLDGWEHWKMIDDAYWMKDIVKRWREELYLKIAARALNGIKTISRTNTRDAMAAQRYLIEKGWIPKDEKEKRGRPSKEDIKKEAQRQVLNDRQLKEDMDRIGLRVVQ